MTRAKATQQWLDEQDMSNEEKYELLLTLLLSITSITVDDGKVKKDLEEDIRYIEDLLFEDIFLRGQHDKG